MRIAVGRFKDAVVIEGTAGPLQVRRGDGSVVGSDRKTAKLTLGKTGLSVSILGQGGAAFGQQYGAVTDAEVKDCVRAAIDEVVRLLAREL